MQDIYIKLYNYSRAKCTNNQRYIRFMDADVFKVKISLEVNIAECQKTINNPLDR